MQQLQLPSGRSERWGRYGQERVGWGNGQAYMSGPCWDSASVVDPKILSLPGVWAECLEWTGSGFWEHSAVVLGLCLGGSLKNVIDMSAAAN